MPVDIHTLGLSTFVNTLVASIGVNVGLFTMQQRMGLSDVIDVGSGGHHRMNKTKLGVGPDVALHAVMPLIPFFGLMHLGVTLTAAVFGRAWCGDDGGVDDGAAVQHQATHPEHGVDGLKEFLGQVVFLQQVTETQDADPIGQSGVCTQSRKVAVQRRLEQGFFHGEVAQAEELLQQVQAQHGLVRKGWTSGCLRWHHGRELRNKIGPRNDAVHQLQQFHLARSLRAQVQAKVLLLHADIFRSAGGVHALRWAEF